MSANVSTIARYPRINYGNVERVKRVATHVAQNVFWPVSFSGNTTHVQNPRSAQDELELELKTLMDGVKAQLEEVEQEQHKSLQELKEEIILSLGRLEDDWDEMGSLAPSDDTQWNVERLLHQLKFDADQNAPEVEVDESGDVTLRWNTPDRNSLAFSVSHLDEVVVCSVKSNGSLNFAQAVDVQDSEALDSLIGKCNTQNVLSVY